MLASALVLKDLGAIPTHDLPPGMPGACNIGGPRKVGNCADAPKLVKQSY